MFRREATNTNIIIFGFTEFKPRMYYTRGDTEFKPRMYYTSGDTEFKPRDG
jgi:hypothetical protein